MCQEKGLSRISLNIILVLCILRTREDEGENISVVELYESRKRKKRMNNQFVEECKETKNRNSKTTENNYTHMRDNEISALRITPQEITKQA